MSKPACEMCGQPYHRYSPDDPEHDWDPVACINSCRHRIDELEAALRPQRQYVARLEMALGKAWGGVSPSLIRGVVDVEDEGAPGGG